MKKIILTALLTLVVAVPHGFAKDKKNNKFDKKEVVIETPADEQVQEQTVAIINPSKQLYGEWTVENVKKKTLLSQERAYIYLDFNNHMFYGSNGCNTINGKFTQSGNNISFKDIISTAESCQNHNDRGLLKTLAEVQHLQVTTLNGIEHMQLMNGKNNVLITLRRQNLDILNGAWQVKEIEENNVAEKNIRMVIDIDMLTIHANTGCNIINGIVTLDPNKNFAVQFEDLRSGGYTCDNIANETNMLLALEQAECYTCLSNDEIEFKTLDGKKVLVITRMKLKRRIASSE